MKNKSLIIVAIVIVTSFIIACSNHAISDYDSSVKHKVQRNCLTEDCFDINVVDFINDNPTLFPHPVLVLDSLPRAFRVLDSLRIVDSLYQIDGGNSLRLFMQDYNFYNPILNSHMVYDSIVKVKLEAWNETSLDEVEDLDNVEFDFFDDLFASLYDHDDELSIYQESFEGNPVTVIEPIGDYDMYALFNEDSLLVIDRILLKILPDSNVIACDIAQYEEFAEYNSYNTLMDVGEFSFTEGDVRYTSVDSIKWSLVAGPAYWSRMSNNTRDYYTNIPYKSYKQRGTTVNGSYKIYMKLSYHFYWHWITRHDTDLHTHLYIKNYKRCRGVDLLTKLPIFGHVYFGIAFVLNPIPLITPYAEPVQKSFPSSYDNVDISCNASSRDFRKISSTETHIWASQITGRQFVITDAEISNGRATIDVEYNVQQ